MGNRFAKNMVEALIEDALVHEKCYFCGVGVITSKEIYQQYLQMCEESGAEMCPICKDCVVTKQEEMAKQGEYKGAVDDEMLTKSVHKHVAKKLAEGN